MLGGARSRCKVSGPTFVHRSLGHYHGKRGEDRFRTKPRISIVCGILRHERTIVLYIRMSMVDSCNCKVRRTRLASLGNHCIMFCVLEAVEDYFFICYKSSAAARLGTA